MRHLSVVSVNGVKRSLIFQTEYEDYCVNPGRKLKQKQFQEKKPQLSFILYQEHDVLMVKI